MKSSCGVVGEGPRVASKAALSAFLPFGVVTVTVVVGPFVGLYIIFL